MNVVELNITGSCKLTLTNYGESAHKDVCLEYVEHSPDAYYSDRDTSIDLDATKAAEIIGFLYKAFPELVTAPAEPAAPAQQEPDAIVTTLTSVPDGVLRSGLDRELPLMAGVYLSPQTPAAPAVDCHATGVCVQSGLRAEKPADPVQPIGYEKYVAIREGHRNASEDAYFAGRPDLPLTTAMLKLFRDGFDRGYDTIAPEKVKS